MNIYFVTTATKRKQSIINNPFLSSCVCYEIKLTMIRRKYFNKNSGVYKTQDSVNNFKCCVTLRKLSSFIQIPKYENHLKNEDTVENEEKLITVGWQEKVFSDTEIERYKNKENCKTDVQKNNHKIIRDNSLHDEARSSCTLFTYVTDDQYVPEENEELFCKQSFGKASDKSLDDVLTNFETMYIMADINPEVVLFTIKYRNGTFIIYPDFNDVQANPYFLEIDLDSRRMYNYGIKNLSKNQDEDGRPPPQVSDLVDKLSKVSLNHDVMASFALPPKKCQTVFLALQILSAENFEYDNIHIRYQLNVPKQCEVLEGSLRGSTHSSKKLRSLWNFGYCCDWYLQCSSDFNVDDSLSINFELISVDSWERERTEGYSSFSLKLTPCIIEKKLLCFREVGETQWLDSLQRVFIGGRKQFELNDFNETSKNGFLNRYGNTTMTTGTLDVKLQMIVQKHPEKVYTWNELSENDGNIEGRSSLKSKILTIDDILIAYQKARTKLEAITSDLNN